MSETILGISAFYHDSAAAILSGGEIIAAAQEERFTRKKHDSSFPVNAIDYVIRESGIPFKELDAIAFYDKPYIKFERLLETYHAFVPRGLASFLPAIPVWIREKLFMKNLIRDELARYGRERIPLLFPEHHLSHAASAFYPSPFAEAAILTVDGVGEWATAAIGHGTDNRISILRELYFPHSIGLFYSAFTYYCGFRVNSGEYKLMGLAPYSHPLSPGKERIKKIILEELVDIRNDGSVLLNMKYFRYATGLRMTDDRRWTRLFGFPPRQPESEIGMEYMDMALAVQEVLEEIILRLADTARQLTGSDYLVMAGGVALNAVANGRLLASGIYRDIWVQPAAGDAGGAVGAACSAWHIWKGRERKQPGGMDGMKGAFLGPSFTGRQILSAVEKYNAPCHYYEDFNKLSEYVAVKIAGGAVIGWFQGRMEYGPRALGNRSVLGDPRNPEMQKKMNLKIKYREGFRPFAPAVLEEEATNYFELDRPSPYMLLVVPVRKERRNPLPDGYHQRPLREKLYHLRSDIPAVTHIDYSARVQTVDRETNPRFRQLISDFRKLTGCAVIVNTSFNVRGEPIVCTPEDAYKCFMRTEMDYLVMGDYLFDKKEQDEWYTGHPKEKYGLD
jgi:carbamoyltransferase